MKNPIIESLHYDLLVQDEKQDPHHAERDVEALRLLNYARDQFKVHPYFSVYEDINRGTVSFGLNGGNVHNPVATLRAHQGEVQMQRERDYVLSWRSIGPFQYNPIKKRFVEAEDVVVEAIVERIREYRKV